MNTFSFYNPVRIHFGKGVIENLKSELTHYGDNILVVYGGGSIKQNGVYDDVMKQLNELNKNVHELSGVEPNPRVSTARKGIELCKEHKIDFVLAVGGGSVIDCAKLIVAGATVDADAWDVVKKKVIPTSALPLGTVLTLAATASEMNSGSVITNWETKEKYGWGSPHTFPKFSILDPTYTYTVPTNQVVNGVVDTMTHIFEQYFHNATNTPLTDEMCEGILRTIIDVAPKALQQPTNYEHRETLMLAGTFGLNGFLSIGSRGDWATHNIDVNVERFAKMAEKVFGVVTDGKSTRDVALEGILALRTFWDSIGAPSSLADYDITDEKFEAIIEHTMVNGPFGNFAKLDRDDVRAILEASL